MSLSLDELVAKHGWRCFGRCITHKIDPTLFFPSSPRGRGAKEKLAAKEAEAKAHCAKCIVKDNCLEAALANNEQGIAGGTNIHERELILTRRCKQRADPIAS